MKNPVYPLIALFIIASVIYGCTKTSLAPIPKTKLATNNALDTSKTHLSLVVSQPTTVLKRLDTISILGIATSDTAATTIKWSVSPSSYRYTIQSVKGKYIAWFSKAGSYKIKALINGIDSLSTIIKVSDSTFVPPGKDSVVTPPVHKDTIPNPPTYALIPFTGDQITLIPNLYKSALSDTSYIYFTAQTTKVYPCANSTMNLAYRLDAFNNFFIGFINVTQPNGSACVNGPGTLSKGIYFYQNTQKPYMVSGTYALAITFNGVTYNGHIIVSSTSVTFDWNYTSGIVLSTKQLNR